MIDEEDYDSDEENRNDVTLVDSYTLLRNFDRMTPEQKADFWQHIHAVHEALRPYFVGADDKDNVDECCD